MGGCSFPMCHNASEKGFKMVRFPQSVDMRNKWATACNISKPVNDNHRLCEGHFSKGLFEIQPHDYKLRKNVVPDILVPSPPKPFNSAVYNDHGYSISTEREKSGLPKLNEMSSSIVSIAMESDKTEETGEGDKPATPEAAVETNDGDENTDNATDTQNPQQEIQLETSTKDQFSDAEMKVLIEEVEKRHEALFGDYKPGESPKCRWLVWQEVAEKVNEVNPDVYRNLEQVRVAWFEHKSPKSKWVNKQKLRTGMFTKGIFDKRMKTELMKDEELEKARSNGTSGNAGNSGKTTAESSVGMQKENSPPKRQTASTSTEGNEVKSYSRRRGRPANWTKQEVEAVLSLDNDIRQSISIRYLTSLVNRMKQREQNKEYRPMSSRKGSEDKGKEDGGRDHRVPSAKDPAPHFDTMLDAENKEKPGALKRGGSLSGKDSPPTKRQHMSNESSLPSDNYSDTEFAQDNSGTQGPSSPAIQPINIKKLMPGSQTKVKGRPSSSVHVIKATPGTQISDMMAQHPGSKLVKLPNGALGIVIAKGNVGDKVLLGDKMILKDLSAPSIEITKAPTNQDELLQESASPSGKTDAGIKKNAPSEGYPDTLIMRDPITGRKVALARVKDPKILARTDLKPLWPNPTPPKNLGLKNVTSPRKPIPILPNPYGSKVATPNVSIPVVHKLTGSTGKSVFPVEKKPGMISYKKSPVPSASPKASPTGMSNVTRNLNTDVLDLEDDLVMLSPDSGSEKSPTPNIKLPDIKKDLKRALDHSSTTVKKGIQFGKGHVPGNRVGVGGSGTSQNLLKPSGQRSAQITSTVSDDKVIISTISNKTNKQTAQMIISKGALGFIEKEGTVVIKHPITGKDVILKKIPKSPTSAVKPKGTNVPTDSLGFSINPGGSAECSGTSNTTVQAQSLSKSPKAANPFKLQATVSGGTTSKQGIPSKPVVTQVRGTPVQHALSQEGHKTLKRTSQMPDIPPKFRVIDGGSSTASVARIGEQLTSNNRRKQSLSNRGFDLDNSRMSPSVRIERSLWLDKHVREMKVMDKTSGKTTKNVKKIGRIIVKPSGTSYVACIDNNKVGVIHSARYYKEKQGKMDAKLSDMLRIMADELNSKAPSGSQTTGTVKKTSLANKAADSKGTHSKSSSPNEEEYIPIPSHEKPYDSEPSSSDESYSSNEEINDDDLDNLDTDELRKDLKKPMLNRQDSMMALLAMMTPGRHKLTRKDMKVMEIFHGSVDVKQYRNLTPISRAGAITERCARTGFISDMDLKVLKKAFNEFVPRIKLALTKSKEYSTIVDKGGVTETISKEIKLFNDAVDEVIAKYEMMQRYLSRVVAICEQENKSGPNLSKVSSEIGKDLIKFSRAKVAMELSLMLTDFDRLASDLIHAKVEIPTLEASESVKGTPKSENKPRKVDAPSEQPVKKAILLHPSPPSARKSPEQSATKAVPLKATKLGKVPEQATIKVVSPKATAAKVGESPEQVTTKASPPITASQKVGNAKERATIKSVTSDTATVKVGKVPEQATIKVVPVSTATTKVGISLDQAAMKVSSPETVAQKVGMAKEQNFIITPEGKIVPKSVKNPEDTPTTKDKLSDVQKGAVLKPGPKGPNILQKNVQGTSTIKPKSSDLKILPKYTDSSVDELISDEKVNSPQSSLLKVRKDLGQDDPENTGIEEELKASKVRVTYSREVMLPSKILSNVVTKTFGLGTTSMPFDTKNISGDANKSTEVNKVKRTTGDGAQLVDISDASSFGEEDNVLQLNNEERSLENGVKQVGSLEKLLGKPGMSPKKTGKNASPMKVAPGRSAQQDLHPLVAAALSGQPSDFKKLLKLETGATDSKNQLGPDGSPRRSNSGISNKTAGAKDCGTSSKVVTESKRTTSPKNGTKMSDSGAKVSVGEKSKKKGQVCQVPVPQSTNTSASNVVTPVDADCRPSENKSINVKHRESPSAKVTSPASSNTRILKVVLPSVDADGKRWELKPNSVTESNLRKSLSVILDKLGTGADNTKICFVQHNPAKTSKSTTSATPTIDKEPNTIDTETVPQNCAPEATIEPSVVNSDVEKETNTDNAVTVPENNATDASTEPVVDTAVDNVPDSATDAPMEPVVGTAVDNEPDSATDAPMEPVVGTAVDNGPDSATDAPMEPVVNTDVDNVPDTDNAVTVPENSVPVALIEPELASTDVEKEPDTENAVNVSENSTAKDLTAQKTTPDVEEQPKVGGPEKVLENNLPEAAEAQIMTKNPELETESTSENDETVPENPVPEVPVAQTITTLEPKTKDAVNVLDSGVTHQSAAPAILTVDLEDDSVPQTLKPPTIITLDLDDEPKTHCVVNVPEDNVPQTRKAPTIVTVDLEEDPGFSILHSSINPTVITLDVDEEPVSKDIVNVPENTVPQDTTAQMIIIPDVEVERRTEEVVKFRASGEKTDICTAEEKSGVENVPHIAELVERVEDCGEKVTENVSLDGGERNDDSVVVGDGLMGHVDLNNGVGQGCDSFVVKSEPNCEFEYIQDWEDCVIVEEIPKI